MIKQTLKYLVNSLGPKLDKKYVIFCSDDWGGIRLSSVESREHLISFGIDLESNRFDRYDVLESNRDIERIFEILLSYKDVNDKHPVITAVTNPANPNFEKIANSNFTEYHYETFVDTLKRYDKRDKVFQYYQYGLDKGIWIPEFHGREHLQISWWLANLNSENVLVRKAFNEKYFFLDGRYLNNPLHLGLGAAFDMDSENDLISQRNILEDGLKLFKDLFEYSSCYFTPPSMHYNVGLEEVLHCQGIKWIDVNKWRKMPVGKGRRKTKIHHFGQVNKFSQRYLTRNCVFESNIDSSDGVDSCMKSIDQAFSFKQPAIISNHRASFVSGIDVSNGDKGVRALDTLLHKITRKWPDVQFITVNDLMDLVNK